ncbi:hypothetical protein CRI94_12095 [Longibacter salinarum]|uniref:Histidine kinase domain-containing protein n=1 Tax=Longibacter salinarum TaxID=1850348 RepID=A0A2A8CVY4_9BACT|nr:ATP-binding protein [Longibacter salinarum]PEN12757.1 hypothetical protein CRI94_12095 [Longibacter salinarum]
MREATKSTVLSDNSSSTSSVPSDSSSNAERIVVWAPVGRTAGLIRQALEHAGMAIAICENADAFCDLVRDGAGAALLTEEVFTTNRENATCIAEFLDSQPPWSDLPVKVFVSNEHGSAQLSDRLRQVNPQRGVTMLDRPIRPAVLVSIMEAALRNRRRQYKLRDALQALHETNETLDDRVQKQTADLRRLAGRLTRAEQAERRRISQLLHDDLQQLLYGVNLKLSAVNSQMEEWSMSKVHEHLEEARTWVEDAFALTRKLTSDLSPPVLEGDDFGSAVQWLRIHMKNLHDLEVTVESVGQHRIEDEDLRELVFQIVRELLFNVKKHSNTTEATVRLTEEPGYLVVHVIDDGGGFDVEIEAQKTKQEGGFGLFSAAERLDLMGGGMEIDSTPGKGTHVTIHTSA